MKKLIFLLPLLLLISCSEKRYSEEIFGYFDTVVSVDGYFDSKKDFDEAYSIVVDTLREYHEAFDIHGGGELQRLNEERALTVSDELKDAILFGIEAERRTNGYCNIALGSVISLWHEAREADVHYLPSKNTLIQAGEHTDIENILIEGSKITLLDDSLTLDLGAVSKGYVADILKKRLEDRGFDEMIVNLGGNVIVIGDKNGEGWRVGVQNPEGDGLIETVSVSDSSLVTSGSYQRYFEFENKTYHHIISPDTLYPADLYLSVSVLFGESIWADALSTALFSMSIEDGKKVLSDFEGIGVLWVTKNGEKIYYGSLEK